MPVGFQLYDQEHEVPARRGNVVDLWGADEDWEFPLQGALALQPEPVEPVEEPEITARASVPIESARSFATVPRMATTGSPRLRRAGEAAPA